jgi:hypothetical protein
MENKAMLATSMFYAIAGIIFLAWMALANFPPHIAIIGIFSLATAYGTLRKRSWTIWLVIIMFFTVTTFSAFMIYDILTRNTVLGTSMIAYLILTWIFTAYRASKRNTLES